MGDAARQHGDSGRNKRRPCLPVQTILGEFPDAFTGQGGPPPLRVSQGQIYETDASVPGNHPEGSPNLCRIVSPDVTGDAQPCQIVHFYTTMTLSLYLMYMIGVGQGGQISTILLINLIINFFIILISSLIPFGD